MPGPVKGWPRCSLILFNLDHQANIVLILSISENILYFVCGFGVLQGILLAALVYFHPKSDRSVTIFLALYIFSTSAIMSLPFVLKIVGWQNSFLSQPFPLLGGPLLYLYIRSFKERISWRKALPHFIPFFLFFFLAYWNIDRWRGKYPDAIDLPAEMLTDPVTLIMAYLRPLHQLIYFVFTRRNLLSYQRSIRHLFSETSRIDLHWAKLLVYGFLVLVLIFVFLFPLMIRYPDQFSSLLLLNMAIGTPYIYLITYKGFVQPSIWQSQPGIEKKELEEEFQEAEELENKSIQQSRAMKPGLHPDKIGEINKKIIALMENDKLYQETELTVQQVALKVGLPTYQVSQAINEGMKRNFYELVNSYRVEEAKQLLLDPRNKEFTILSVGFEAGFNSKTTFNTVFKKFTGLTPTEFRDKQSAQKTPVL